MKTLDKLTAYGSELTGAQLDSVDGGLYGYYTTLVYVDGSWTYVRFSEFPF